VRPNATDRLFEVAGRALDAAVERLPAPPLDQRVAALRAARHDRGRTRRRRLLVSVTGVVAAASAAFLFWTRPRPLEFEVGASRARGVPGTRLEGGATDTLPLRFSDGTEMVLAAGARGRVLSLAASGAEIVLERGTLHASVARRPTSAWVVGIGPFDVHVKGTRFDATWLPAREVFSLRMFEGVVTVTGPCLPAPRTLTAGEEIDLTCTPGTPAAAPPARAPIDVGDAPAATRAPPPETPFASPEPPPHARHTTRREPTGEDGTGIAPATWRALMAAGDARGALEALERTADLSAACAGAPAGDLMRLGDEARARGKRAHAVRLYTSLRGRFPGGDAAAVAAFHLGQVGFDQGGSRADARAGFAAYLAERPDGPLAREALGRLLELESETDPAAARELARRYLARFPHGPHAALARSLESR